MTHDSRTPEIHPAAELFATGADDKIYVENLAQDIKVIGQKHAIVLTHDGRLLEGRGRWAACLYAGITPITRIERTTNPWLYILNQNNDALRGMSNGQISMVVGRVPQVKSVGNHVQELDEPPARRFVGELAGVSPTTVYRAQLVQANAVPELVALVEAGMATVSTAERVCHSEPEAQREFVKRVRAGESPRKASAFHGPERVKATKSGRVNSPKRLRFVKESALRQLVDTLEALGTVLDNVEGLDPSITPEAAKTWLTSINKGYPAYRRITDQLKQRKEQQS